MATNVTSLPRLPTPPQATPKLPTPPMEVVYLANLVRNLEAQKQADIAYLTDLVRALEIFINQMQNPQLNFQEVPENGNLNILQQGDLYIADGGFLKGGVGSCGVACGGVGKTEIFSGSVSITGELGTVTVAVS